MKFMKIISAFAAAICLGTFIGSPVGSKMILQTEAVSIFEMPSDYTYAADWIWNNRIIPERSTGSADRRYNILFDQIIAGKGTLNYVVRWHSTRTITYEQRQKLEPALEKCVNAWTDWLVGYENWPYQHVDVNIVGWAVTDASRLLDLHSDETVYTDTQPYEVQPGESSEIPTVMANAPSELSRFDHFGDRNYQYPGGLDKRFDMYLWATQGFPEIGGCGGDWGQRLADTYYIGLAEGTASDHVQIHELGHAFSFTDYYGGEGASDGYPPGGFPVEGGGSIMMAGSSSVITDFDGWFMRYVWDKIKDEEGRFDLANALPAKEPVNNNGIKGDVNYDTRVDAYDVIMLNNWLTKTDTLINGENADMNVDGMINVIDLCVLKSYILYGSDNNYVPDSGDDFIHASLSKHGASLPSQGDARLVVFYVDFPDCRYDYAPTVDELQTITFGAADPSNVNYPFESIPAFYSRASKESMNFDGRVFRYTTKESASAYGKDKVKIAEECYEAFKDTVDFSQYDGNKDGKIDATLFTVPAKARDDDWWPCAGAFGDEDYRVDGVAVGHIITGNAQVNSRDSYVKYISSYCHELGHCTGLPDYYLFTSDDSEGMHGSAGIELMDTDAGSDFGAFSKLVEGWYRNGQVMVYDDTKGTQTFTLNNAQTIEGNCLIIPKGKLDDDHFSEYFIIEYASKDGNNSGIGSNIGWGIIPGEGIRVYHIDATTEYGGNNYFRYASGSEFTDSDRGRRLIRIIDDTDTDNFYHSGDVINGSISGFHWYDPNGSQTVDTGYTVTIGSLENGKYTVTVSK